jgi:hypothetical protein
VVRALAWNGSAWVDTKVWNGSQWKQYTPPVYGAGYFREDFNAGGVPAGWTGTGGASSQYTIQYWPNAHVYIHTDAGWYAPPWGTVKTTGTVSAPFRTYIVQPGQTVRAQASCYVVWISGETGHPINVSVSADLYCSELATYSTTITGTASGVGGFGWAVVTSSEYTIPATGNVYQTRTLKLEDIRASFQAEDSLYGTGATYRMYVDWIRLIDQNGNELLRQTSPAVEVVKAWNGTAWV